MDMEQKLLDLMADHESLGNGKARGLLGWQESTYDRIKQSLLTKGLLAQGRGRGGSIRLADSEVKTSLDLFVHEPEPVTYPKRGRGRPPKAQNPEANGQEAPEPDPGSKPKATGLKPKVLKPEKDKSLETWIWDAACSIRGAKDAPKYNDYILPLIFGVLP